MGRNRILTFVSLPLLATPAVAAADEPALPPTETSGVVFPTMGADGTGNQLGAQLMLMNADGEDESLKRLDLNGQFVSPSGMGAYFALGASSVDGETAVGAIEAGALYRRQTGTSAFTARAGLVLPTGTNDGESGFVHLISTAYSRPSDYLTGFPDTTSLRLAVTPSTSRGTFVARADIGLDLPVAGEGADLLDGLFLHVDLGAGFHNGKAGVLAELSTMAYLEETDDLLHLIAITGELTAGKTTPYVTISRPFASGSDGELDITNIAIGLRGRL